MKIDIKNTPRTPFLKSARPDTACPWYAGVGSEEHPYDKHGGWDFFQKYCTCPNVIESVNGNDMLAGCCNVIARERGRMCLSQVEARL